MEDLFPDLDLNLAYGAQSDFVAKVTGFQESISSNNMV